MTAEKYHPFKTLSIRNFQSIRDTTVELSGLVVLCGPGDAGKSAILRALRALCLNDATDDDIRHGEKGASVTLIDEGGVAVEWWKQRGKGGCYRMDGQEFTKTGGAVPEPIADYLGIGRIEVDSTTELTPQLSDQHDPPFIIWESGSKRARILGKATRLDTVVSAQMRCKRELDQHRKAEEHASEELTFIAEQIAALPDYRSIEWRVTQAESNIEVLYDGLVKAERARELHHKMAAIRAEAAVAVDTTTLVTRLDWAEQELDKVGLALVLQERQEQVAGLTSQVSEGAGQLAALEEQYQQQCVAAGVCPVCNGLLSHKECVHD